MPSVIIALCGIKVKSNSLIFCSLYTFFGGRDVIFSTGCQKNLICVMP